MRKIKQLAAIICVVLGLGLLGYSGYQSNWLDIQNIVLHHKQKTYFRRQTSQQIHLSWDKRQEIRRQMMRQTQTQRGLTKQGYVSIPRVQILQPVFNDAYSRKGLAAGADYANRSQADPQGKLEPRMGQGNYGLASHNFYDGKTGFSPLQENLHQDQPYIVDGTVHENDWLNGQKIYLANDKGIYEYRISRQHVVPATDVRVLDSTKQAQVTVITCLYPSKDYRIITVGLLAKSYTWQNAPDKVVDLFDLTKQKTNARADWYNPGAEEGANGEAGGTQ